MKLPVFVSCVFSVLHVVVHKEDEDCMIIIQFMYLHRMYTNCS